MQWAASSIRRTSNQWLAVLPNLGGSLPNDIFAVGLDLPTIWVPHSYPGCSQHAPNEHLPMAVAREGPGSIGIWAKVARLLRDEGSVRLSGIAVLAARKAVAALGAGGTRKMPPQQTQLLPRSYERERMAMIEIAVTAQHTIR